MYSISRKNGVSYLRIPARSKNKETLKLSGNFAFLLPFNCVDVSGKEFAKVILEIFDSVQASAVANALQES